jgi:hypothetical protein
LMAVPNLEVRMTATDRTVLDQLVQETKKETAPEMKDDEFFELFCAQSLLINEQLEPEEIKFDLVGSNDKLKNGSDGGLDAIYVFVNGKPVRSAEEADTLKSAYRQNIKLEVVMIQASRGSRHNFLFYTMMVATCMVLKTAKPRSARISTIDTEKQITDDLLHKSLKIVIGTYQRHGANDKAAKGTDMPADIKKQKRDLFGRKSKKK